MRHAVILCLLTALACAGAVELLHNPGFEGPGIPLAVPATAVARLSGDLAAGWKDNSDWADLEARYAVDPEIRHGGATSQRVEFVAGRSGSPQLIQEFPAKPGAAYTARVWVRASAPIPVNLIIRQAASPYAIHARRQVLAGPEWQEMEATWTAAVAEPVLLLLNPERPGTVWFDDVALAATAPPPSSGPLVELLRNPGFETAFTPIGPDPARKAMISGELGDGWSDDSGWAEVELRYAADREVKHSGAASQRVQIRAVRSGQVQFVQNLRLAAGRTYHAAVWVRSSTPMPLQLNIRQGPKPYRGYAGTRGLALPEWRQLALTWIQPEDADGMLMLVPSTPATLWIDDATVTDITGRPAPGEDAPVQDGNLLTNGSFEAGMGNLWNQAWGSDAVVWGSATTIAGGTHGARALRLAVRGSPFRVHTAPVQTQAGRVHTFAVDLRASKPIQVELKLDEANSRLLEVGTNWQRHHISGKVGASAYGWISVIDEGVEADLDVDAAQIEEGGSPTAYRPRFAHELVLAGGGPGRIVRSGDTLRLAPTIAPTAPPGAQLRVTVTDLAGSRRELPPAPPAAFAIPPDPAKPNGTWLVEVTLLAADGSALSDPTSLTFSRLPAPRQVDGATSYFGTHLPFNATGIAIAQATGTRWLRVHDVRKITKWAAVEPERDQFVFADAGIDAARAAGLHVLGMLDGAPGWATTGKPKLDGYFKHWHLPNIADADALWTRYVDRTVRHYAGRIDHWQVWNEPWSYDHFFPGGTPERYVQLLRLAHSAAKAANPSCTIVGLTTAANQDAFTEPVLAESGTALFDVFSWHEYNVMPGGGWPAAIVEKFRGMQAQHGQPRPQIATETGNTGQVVGLAGGASRELALASAAWIVRVDVELLAAGLVRNFWYSAGFTGRAGVGSHSAIEHDGAIKPAFAARAVLAWMVDGAQCTGLVTDAKTGLVRVGFRHPDGRVVTVVWSAYGERILLPVPPESTLHDLFGNPLPAEGAAVDALPVYLVAAARRP